MNYLRMKDKNILLTSIDYKKNVKDYLSFNDNNKTKNIEDLKNELNDFSVKNYFAIIENKTHKLVGIIGFKNTIQTNQRSNIDLILSEELSKEKIVAYGSEALKCIADYAYDSLNLHNLLCEDDNLDLYNMYIDAGYEYIGSRHASVLKNNKFNDLHFYQKLPFNNKKSKHLLVLDSNQIIKTSDLPNGELPEIVSDKNVTLIRPHNLDKNTLYRVKQKLGRSLNDSFVASAMGEYKMIYNDYRLNKKLSSNSEFDYMILDETGNVIGYVNRLYVNDDNARTDIEINIFNKSSRNKGYGKNAYQLYTKTLRTMGYVSIGSVVFDFNTPSIKMHEKLGFNEYVLRNESYYAFGKLNDMHYYEADFTEELGYNKSKGGNNL